MARVLMITHMASMIEQFNRNNIQILLDLGCEVHVAANFISESNTMTPEQLRDFKIELGKRGVIAHQIDFERGLGSFKANIKVWKQLKQIVSNQVFDLIHCQSPIGGVFGRLIGHKYNVPVIYTAHGFQFFKRSGIKNWLFFYPIEKALSYFTRTLITINNEDTQVAKRFSKRMNVVQIPGVGIDYNRFVSESKSTNMISVRKQLDIPEDAFVIISVGELSKRKNHAVILNAINQLPDKSNIYYIICGIGAEKKFLEQLAQKNNFTKNIKLLGYRKNIPELYAASDICAFPSLREGLGLAGIEAMACGLPIVTSNINGILDYSQNGITGFSNSPTDVSGFSKSIKALIQSPDLVDKMGHHNVLAAEKYDQVNVNKKMYEVYSSILKHNNI